VPIVVLTVYTEKEYEPFDPYSRFYPAMPVSACFQDTALCTLSKVPGDFFFSSSQVTRALEKAPFRCAVKKGVVRQHQTKAALVKTAGEWILPPRRQSAGA